MSKPIDDTSSGPVTPDDGTSVQQLTSVRGRCVGGINIRSVPRDTSSKWKGPACITLRFGWIKSVRFANDKVFEALPKLNLRMQLHFAACDLLRMHNVMEEAADEADTSPTLLTITVLRPTYLPGRLKLERRCAAPDSV